MVLSKYGLTEVTSLGKKDYFPPSIKRAVNSLSIFESFPTVLLGLNWGGGGGGKGLYAFQWFPATRWVLARSSPRPRSLPRAKRGCGIGLPLVPTPQRERCDSRRRLVPGHKQPLTSHPPPRARPRRGRPS